jgi:leucyl aminopeptidase (aminopeptidase T)
MKRTIVCLAILLAIGAFGAQAGEPDYDAIAESIVNQSLMIQPGESVLINGGPAEIDLMGALQVAVAKAGGQSLISLNIPHANKRTVMETPIEHLGQTPTLPLMITRAVDATINVGSVQDPGLFSDVPEERLKAAREAATPLNDAFRVPTMRNVTLGQTGGIPTDVYAESRGADPAAMQAMFWQAVGVTPAKLAEIGNNVSGMLEPGTSVSVKTDAGTDLSFKVDKVPARINAGRTGDVIQSSGAASVWLPAGEAYACVDLGSANGTLVVPSMTFRGKPVENLRMQFKNGSMVSVSADSSEKMLKDYLAATDDKTKHLALVDLGLNGESQPLEGSDYYSWEMGGMVTLGMGNNVWAGGDNTADGAMNFHLVGATVEIGGKTVVKSGKLSM